MDILLSCTSMRERLKLVSSGEMPLQEVVTAGNIEKDTGTLISHGYIRPAVLRGARIYNLNWSNFTLSGVVFIECEFDKMDFSSADLRGSSFTDCSFVDCTFNDADLAGTNIHSCIFNRCTSDGVRWTGAEVSRCKFLLHSPSINWPDTYRNEVYNQ